MFTPVVAGLTLTWGTVAWTAESSDVQQVRDLLYKE